LITSKHKHKHFSSPFLNDFSPSAQLRLFIIVAFSAPNENEHVRPVAAAQLLLMKINTSMWIPCRIQWHPVAPSATSGRSSAAIQQISLY